MFTFISPPGSLSGLSAPVSCFPPGHVHFPRLHFCLYVVLSSTQSFVSVSFIISCVSKLFRFGFWLFLQCFSWLYPVFSNLGPELCNAWQIQLFSFLFSVKQIWLILCFFFLSIISYEYHLVNIPQSHCCTTCYSTQQVLSWKGMKDLSQQFHTESQQAMNFSDFIIWTNFMFCLPLTLLVICWLCCLVCK